jgi:hypothetical protein
VTGQGRDYRGQCVLEHPRWARHFSVADAITLGDVAGQFSMLEIACSRCYRQGRLPVARLIERHNADMKLPGVRDRAGPNINSLLRARSSRVEPPQWNSFARHQAPVKPLPRAARGHEVRAVFVNRDNLTAIQYQHQPHAIKPGGGKVRVAAEDLDIEPAAADRLVGPAVHEYPDRIDDLAPSRKCEAARRRHRVERGMSSVTEITELYPQLRHRMSVWHRQVGGLLRRARSGCPRDDNAWVSQLCQPPVAACDHQPRGLVVFPLSVQPAAAAAGVEDAERAGRADAGNAARLSLTPCPGD